MKIQLTILAVAVLLLISSIGFGQCPDKETLDMKGNFKSQPATTQANVWIGHLRFGRDTEGLNDKQKEIVDRFIATIKPEFYQETSRLSAKEISRIEADRAAVAELVPLIDANFTKEQAIRMFYSLTKEEMQGFTLIKASYTNLTKSMAIADCTCSDISAPLCDLCIYNGWPYTCNPTSFGCGPFWYLACNGICTKNTRGALAPPMRKTFLSPLG